MPRLLASAALLALAAAAHAQDPIPPPTGPHPVGAEVIEWTDADRAEPWTPADDRRRLQVQLWYPAAPSDAGPLAYVPALTALRPSWAAYWGEDLDALAFDVPGARLGPPVAEGPFPLVVLSHGMNSPRVMLTALAVDLASHGVVVAAIDHTYWGPGVAFADGTVVPYADGMIARDTLSSEAIDRLMAEGIRVMSDDQSFVARRVLALADADGRWAGRLDPDRVGIAGHSMGGMAADRTCLRDPLARGCVSLDGVLGAAVHVGWEPGCSATPFLLVASAQFEGALDPASTAVPERLRRAWCAPLVRVLEGSRHNAFTDLSLLGASDPGEIGAVEAARVTRRVVAAFFEAVFAGRVPEVDRPGLRLPRF